MQSDEFQPSEAQKTGWLQRYVIWEDGHDERGNWLGWCPVHDASDGDVDEPSAQFNFAHGSMRCMGNPAGGEDSPPCHYPRRAVSFTNAALLKVSRG